MPLGKMNPMYRVTDIKLDQGSGGKGPFLSMNTQFGEAIVLCTSPRGVEKDELELTEDQLMRLFNQETVVLHSPECRLTGYSDEVIALRGGLSDFALEPPVCLQLWRMQADAYSGSVMLYVPDSSEEQSIFCKMSVRALRRQEAENCVLRVEIDPRYQASFQNGMILYSSGSHLPVPVTKDWLNRDIIVHNADAKNVKVFADERAADLYSVSLA